MCERFVSRDTTAACRGQTRHRWHWGTEDPHHVCCDPWRSSTKAWSHGVRRVSPTCVGPGDAAGAAGVFEELLTDHLRVLGPDHPAILTIRSHHAHWRREAGDAASTDFR
jgi:hypothetical protein